MKKSWIHQGTVLIRIGKHHLAFLRAYLEGLDIGDISQRYLETAVEPDSDLRIAKTTLKWIRDQLMVVAKRSSKVPNPRVILINPDKLVVANQKHLPTLEEFREERDPYEMYGESELIEMFQEEFGGISGKVDRKSTRNERLRKKQIDALFYFEKLLGVAPTESDSLHGWLDPVLADRLQVAQIENIGQLIAFVNSHGYRWWRLVPRIGEKAAAQIIAWLNTESVQESIKIRVGKRSSVKSSALKTLEPAEVRAKQFGMVPIEYLMLPDQFSGVAGKNRNPSNWTNIVDDYDAIHKWLKIRTKPNSHTWRNYRKEAERFLLWAILEKQIPLSSVTGDECSDYILFLSLLDSDPSSPPGWPFKMPCSAWTAPRFLERSDPKWRPFEGKLTNASIHQAVTIVRSLFSWLLDVGYLQHNPWKSVPLTKKSSRQTVTRAFSFYEWNYLLNFLENQERDSKYDRMRFILIFLHGTGLRLSEIVNARISDIKRVQYVQSGLKPDYELVVVGKGNIEGNVTLSDKCLNELDRYLHKRGLENRFQCPENTYLIGRHRESAMRKGKSILDEDTEVVVDIADDKLQSSAIYQSLKQFFKKAILPLKEDIRVAEENQNFEYAFSLREMAKRIESGSTHWLRHTCATHMLASGVSIQTMQSNLRHKSVDTTSVYINQESSVKNAEINAAMDLLYKR
ncbi:phage integrase family protein [Undibacterium oligocarboniphilum]|uniref:Tyrosine-type recombinase/integrase n=1 Tax=Undibacterium oligocarboniphilum TaxID=666702 RepID=A0A850QN00_9BURK|nr:phage integrase family protein [Undibacterium oligocarboniphilum]MBC3871399.1 tyrosine-type recombinase/integrase [Undibacterium oligocarboniphilum]NVO79025.1 tyrosine-type recombinase/integrase [Undibacterium oligocarboniphilum]